MNYNKLRKFATKFRHSLTARTVWKHKTLQDFHKKERRRMGGWGVWCGVGDGGGGCNVTETGSNGRE